MTRDERITQPTDWTGLEDQPRLHSVWHRGVELQAGHRVRLLPRRSADIFDLALEGKLALIEAIEQDYEEKIYLAVVVDDDPGRDLGLLRQPGHRFFYALDEVEPVSMSEGQTEPGRDAAADAEMTTLE